MAHPEPTLAVDGREHGQAARRQESVGVRRGGVDRVDAGKLTEEAVPKKTNRYFAHLGIADGVSIARVWACRDGAPMSDRRRQARRRGRT